MSISPISGRNTLDLASFDVFILHPWVKNVIETIYEKKHLLSEYAITRMVNDLKEIDKKFRDENGYGIFTSVEGRAKDKNSYLGKLYRLCKEEKGKNGCDQKSIISKANNIKDLCGVRFSCPYFDGIEPAIALCREKLALLGYATDLKSDTKLSDKNYLEIGDDKGYRSYHWYVRIPTVIDIWGKTEFCLCEVQARSELQHVWAVKSHDIFYKKESSLVFSDIHVLTDMKHISDNLRSADQYLISVRDRVKEGRK
jgi:ppGpp synthetase/RelA/SpoT-type nucleotidyltranferase